MQENTHHITLPTKGRTAWYLSVGLLIVMIAGSLGLYGYDMYLTSEIATQKSMIADTEKQISEIARDRDIIITKIAESNTIRPSLDLRTLITQFKAAADEENVRLKGFSVKNDTITTSLIATEGDPSIHPDPAATIIKMMREYASTQKYFSLEPIVSLSGDDKKRTTGITFHVVATPLKK